MPIELTYLALCVVLFIVMIVVQALGSIRSNSMSFLVGPRDGMVDKTDFSGRCRRANANMIEGMVMFVPLVLIVVHMGMTSPLTALGAACFFFGRLIFAPTYWLGVPWVRTRAWFVSIAGILMLLWEIFL